MKSAERKRGNYDLVFHNVTMTVTVKHPQLWLSSYLWIEQTEQPNVVKNTNYLPSKTYNKMIS